MSFKDRLKVLRTQSGLTQNDLAKILNCSRSTISAYESGRNEPSYEVIQKLADHFDVSVDWILCRTDSHTAKAREKGKTPKASFIDVSDLPEEEVKKVKEFADLLRLKLKFDKNQK